MRKNDSKMSNWQSRILQITLRKSRVVLYVSDVTKLGENKTMYVSIYF